MSTACPEFLSKGHSGLDPESVESELRLRLRLKYICQRYKSHPKLVAERSRSIDSGSHERKTIINTTPIITLVIQYLTKNKYPILAKK